VYTVTDTANNKVYTYHYNINLNIVTATPCTATYASTYAVSTGFVGYVWEGSDPVPTIDLSSSTVLTVELPGV